MDIIKRYIYLIRHSEQYRKEENVLLNENSQINNEKIILSVQGEKKAEILSKIKELCDIDEVWSSSYVRAKSTAKYIAENNKKNIKIDERLNERKLGNIDSLEKLGLNMSHPYTEEQLLNSKLTNINGESREEVSKRFNEFINELLKDDNWKKVAVVSHGASIKFFLVDFCKLNDNIELVYKEKILKVESPGVIEVVFENNEVIDIKKVDTNI